MVVGHVVPVSSGRRTRGRQTGTRGAESTRLIFEAAHRPYLQVLMYRGGSFFFEADFYRFHYSIKNHGPVPAILTERHLIVRMDGQEVVRRPVPPAIISQANFPAWPAAADASRPRRSRVHPPVSGPVRVDVHDPGGRAEPTRPRS
jgi:hypothetical protein